MADVVLLQLARFPLPPLAASGRNLRNTPDVLLAGPANEAMIGHGTTRLRMRGALFQRTRNNKATSAL